MTAASNLQAAGMTEEQAKKLRAPFPKSAIGLLPKPYKKDSPKGNCKECGGYHGLPAVHLDYVGHAATTDRLLQVDPGWTWEPLAYTPEGLPALDRAGNLWIKLTVAGVTRLGVGDGASAKECIGDAIRNAAMRFGVALDLWAKEDLEGSETPPVEASRSGGAGTRNTPPPPGGAPAAPQAGGATAAPRALNAAPKAAPPDFAAPTGTRGGATVAKDTQKKLTALCARLIPAGAITEEQFVKACGVDADSWATAIPKLPEGKARDLVGRLERLEANTEKDAA